MQNCNLVQIVDSTYVVQKAKLLNYFATALSTKSTRMIPDDGPTSQPPDFCEYIDDDVEKEETIKKKISTFEISNKTPPFTENVIKFEEKKNENKIRKLK